MKGDPEFVILKYSAWLETAKFESRILGSIIRYPLRPTFEYLPDSPLQYNTCELVEGSLIDFVLTNTNAASHDASAALHSVAGFDFKGNTKDSVRLAGKLIRYKRLQQHGRFWTQLKADRAIRDEVPGWISLFNTWPPCLVVGVMMAEDVELDFSGAATREYKGQIELPLATIALAAAGAPAGLTGGSIVGNAQAGAGASRELATVFKAKTEQSNIFALELRIVTTALLRRQELALKEDGPTVDPGRLAGDDDAPENENDEKPLAVEDLVLECFVDKEYDQMVD
ncbi:hypothetical protein AUP68_08459 [Ilyonectria robusta]